MSSKKSSGSKQLTPWRWIQSSPNQWIRKSLLTRNRNRGRANLLKVKETKNRTAVNQTLFRLSQRAVIHCWVARTVISLVRVIHWAVKASKAGTGNSMNRTKRSSVNRMSQPLTPLIKNCPQAKSFLMEVVIVRKRKKRRMARKALITGPSSRSHHTNQKA